MLSQRNPALAAKIAQLQLPLAPLVSLPLGQVHQHFPRTLLSFWLLTAEQLDDLAHFYHQRTPGPWSNQYPCPVIWRRDATIEEKRMNIGRFIGLLGCQGPSGLLTEEDILAEVRRQREEQAEKDRFHGKGKWY